ncbi:MAG: hypothetical protein ABL921_03525, partial [Pirellula sp.]
MMKPNIRRMWLIARVDVDAEPNIAEQFEASALPSLRVLGPDDKTVASSEGYMPLAELTAWLDQNYRQVDPAIQAMLYSKNIPDEKTTESLTQQDAEESKEEKVDDKNKKQADGDTAMDWSPEKAKLAVEQVLYRDQKRFAANMASASTGGNAVATEIRSRLSQSQSFTDIQRQQLTELLYKCLAGSELLLPINPEDIPTVVAAKCAVKAEWKLPTTDSDALALVPIQLKDQVTQRDLAGKGNKAKLAGEQQDQLEEMERIMSEQGYGGQVEATGPQIVFLGRVADDVEKGAIKAAFDEANKKAKGFSAATGVKLGKLKSVSKQPDAEDVGTPVYAAYGYARTPRALDKT